MQELLRGVNTCKTLKRVTPDIEPVVNPLSNKDFLDNRLLLPFSKGKEEKALLRRFLRAKLHKATVTEANLEYEGSITIDEDLMDLVGIGNHEFVLVSNMNNGERFETYVIPGPRGSGVMCLNGSTARKGLKGDRIIVFAIAFLTEDEISSHKAKIVTLGDNNKPR